MEESAFKYYKQLFGEKTNQKSPINSIKSKSKTIQKAKNNSKKSKKFKNKIPEKKVKNDAAEKINAKINSVCSAEKPVKKHLKAKNKVVVGVREIAKDVTEPSARLDSTKTKPNTVEVTQPKMEIETNSIEMGKKAFEFLIHPISIDVFFRDYWEKKPLLIREKKDFFSKFKISLETFKKAIEENEIFYGEHVDVALFKNDKRQTLTPPGNNRVHPVDIDEYFECGHSLRLLNPLTYFSGLCDFNKCLSEFFGTMVGANMYLTPKKKSQGFAPHYDDIEAFVLQLEGCKEWKVYEPQDELTILPRESSQNFSKDDLNPALMTVVLEPGDVLYFPRGFIHQASSLEQDHSIHVTISTYQKNSWADFLEILVPAALKVATEEDVEFRSGLPVNFLNYMGLARSNDNSVSVQRNRDQFKATVKGLINKIVDDFADTLVDEAADQMGRDFMRNSLPASLFSSSDFPKLHDKSLVKLRSFHCLRLVNDENGLVVYYNVDNSKNYQARREQSLPINHQENCEIIEQLLESYPEYKAVSEFRYDLDFHAKIRFLQNLLLTGLIVTKTE